MADGKPTSSDPQQQYGATTYGFVNPQEQPKLPTYDDATKAGETSRVDEEAYGSTVYGGIMISDCTDASLRAAFICKVYAILCFQLLITFGIVCVFTFVEPVKNYVNGTSNPDSNGWWIMLVVAMCVFLVVYIVIICCKTVRRKVPYNYIFLTIFSMATGYMMGVIASLVDSIAVVQAMCCLAVICFMMTMFGCQTRIPLGAIFIAIFTLSITAFSFAIMAIFTWNNLMPTVYATIVVAIFSLILLVDTWLITNSGHHEVLMEEYVFCALILYVDIIYIFMYLLMILGGSARN
ncbi:protein lifeguard 2-like [Convolutriloba macropyga]|uniref:protein lifeguard 2-like n=1 Tax=Convolutriloba macropyga TaxID=536237 RepID=UPI003F522F4F